MNFRIIGGLIDLIVKSGCMVLLAIGLWYIFGNLIKDLFKEEQRYRKLEKTIRAGQKKRQSKLIEHVNSVLTTAISHKMPESGAYIFLMASIAVFIFSFLSVAKLFTLAFSLFIATSISVFPYTMLRLKLRAVQINSSYDGDEVVTNLTNEYKQHYFNMINAIENCAVRNDIGSYSNKNLYKLSLALKAYHSEEDLDSAIAQFVYSYNTEWAGLLGLNIKMAIHRGIIVSSGLEDILKKLKDSREQIEIGKRYNSETFAMIQILLIPLYIGSIYVACDTFGFTVKKFFEYQFLNPIGLRMGIITFLSMIFSFTALMAIRKPKYDI